jgi:predicted transcriptional regulator
MKIRWFVALILSLIFVGSQTLAQPVEEFFPQELDSLAEGWRGFTSIGFLANALLTLTLAAVLGAIFAYHPKHLQTADTLEELEAPRVYILYAVIGALIGIMVVRYGLVVGFVLFGIGGLIRFRTVLRSARLTGNVIFVTLIGLSCGLRLPHVAVLATVFGFVLIYLLDARITYRIDVRGLSSDRVAEAAVAYRDLLEREGCRIRNETKDPGKERVTLIFHSARHVTRQHLEDVLERNIDETLKGSIDWQMD